MKKKKKYLNKKRNKKNPLIFSADCSSINTLLKILNKPSLNTQFMFNGLKISKLLFKESDNGAIMGRILSSDKNSVEENNNILLQTYYSTIWMSYRKHFSHILETSLVSDTGWGCVLRVTQMMLAQCIKMHHSFYDHNDFNRIISLFIDEISNDSIFSIHNMAKIAYKNYNILPGNWYQPS
jgi:cysteine protease ATG4